MPAKKKSKGSRVRGQGDFFSDRQIKAQVVNRMPEAYFKKLLRKGWDPGYFIEIESDDYPTLSDRLISFGKDQYVEKRYCVVLSKGPSDPNRRVIAQAADRWVVGLWISLLRRQLKQGAIDIKAWCFETLSDLERDESFFKLRYENWMTELLKKEQP